MLASDWTSKLVVSGALVYFEPDEFVVTLHTVVLDCHVAPAVRGHWIVCGGLPETSKVPPAVMLGRLMLMVALIFTIARVSVLNQISAGKVVVPMYWTVTVA